ncbi:unnamed protein product, partial [marine sediment metagenome]
AKIRLNTGTGAVRKRSAVSTVSIEIQIPIQNALGTSWARMCGYPKWIDPTAAA